MGNCRSDICRRAEVFTGCLTSLTDTPSIYAWDFTVTNKEGESLGVAIDSEDGVTLKIILVKKTGLIPEHNKRTDVFPIQENDRIVAVNDIRGDTDAMLQEIEKAGDLTIVLCRDKLISIPLAKGGKDFIGLEVDRPDMTIAAIHGDGAAALYNQNLAANQQHFKLVEHAKIVALNGSADEYVIMNGLESNATFDLLVHLP